MSLSVVGFVRIRNCGLALFPSERAEVLRLLLLEACAVGAALESTTHA
jgi:hypothetical protein